jgi:hypothetical protein
VPVIGSSFTINASTRTFSTNFSSTTIQTNATIGGSATNLFLHLISSVPSGPVRISMPATNQVAIEGALNQAMTASLLTNWGSISYATQAVTAAFTVRVPMSSEPTATNRVRFSSWLVDALRDYPTNSLPGNTFALTNFLNKTNGAQSITGANVYTGANVFSNSAQSIVGGIVSNAALIGGNITNSGANVYRGTNTFGTLFVTNFSGVGSASISNLSAIGQTLAYSFDNRNVEIGLYAGATSSIGGSVVIGLSSTSSVNYGVAIGYQAETQSNAVNSIAIGYSPSALGLQTIAMGRNAMAGILAQDSVVIGRNAQATNGFYAVAIGPLAFADALSGFAMGYNAKASNAYAMAFGYNVRTTDTNQIRLGDSSYIASFPGAAAFSNAVYVGSAERDSLPTSMTAAVILKNGTAATAEPTNAAALNSVSGALRYRQSGETTGTNNYVHNRTDSVTGSGTDYSLTTTYALVDFSGTDPEFNTLPTSGTYLVMAQVTFNCGANSGDDFAFKFYNATAASDVSNSEVQIDGDGHNGIHPVTVQAVITITTPSRIQLYGKNNTANRGSVTSTLTKLTYVRLY